MQARDALLLLSGIDWTPVVVAGFTLAGVVVNGIVLVWIASRVRTPSGKRIGAQVEDTHHVSLANNYRIQSLASALDVPGQPDDPNTRKREADADR